MQSEAEKLIEEVARVLHDKMCSQDINGYLDTQIDCTELARAVTALIVERCAKYHDDQAEAYRAHDPLPGEDSYEFQIRFHECSAGQLRSLIPEAPQPEAKEARE